MSLRDVDAVDYIGINILFKRVYVGLFDDLDRRDENEHRDLLTKKIDRYIRYIRSGQLLLNYPKVRGYEIVLEYVSMHPMTPSGLEFWKSRERVLGEAGYKAHIRGVDVRPALGISVEKPEHVDAEPVEPPALEVLDADPSTQALTDIADIAYLPPLSSDTRRRQTLPVLKRLAIRQVATH
ncbi:hypothetical protein AWB77_05658 [Caballeronia fortuita]|uniref:Uncharacterized protein n=1 Tax=Caballeronia fortuita TaxID=1777138 RepID=A0A158DQD4_9BURK|nr:DUF6572 domain-containing protein [Caballeronia fortuita]SAK96818.1 hypothetical protein AWB77_05658 [Caballeronia fortuita]